MDDDIQLEINTIWNEAKANIEQGNFDLAIETYKYILIRYDETPIAVERANANLGDIYVTLRKLGSAEYYIKKAISCDPKKTDYHYLLGFVYSKQSLWSKAIKEFQTAVNVEPDNPEYLRGLGWALFNGGYKSGGLEHLHKADEFRPHAVNTLLDLANAYMMLFDFDKATSYVDKAWLVEPENQLIQEVKDKIEKLHKLFEQGKGVT
jgi:tetratricopeptide (TPR) repeat protein